MSLKLQENKCSLNSIFNSWIKTKRDSLLVLLIIIYTQTCFQTRTSSKVLGSGGSTTSWCRRTSTTRCRRRRSGSTASPPARWTDTSLTTDLKPVILSLHFQLCAVAIEFFSAWTPNGVNFFYVQLSCPPQMTRYKC